MTESIINCNHCGTPIELTAAIEGPIIERVKAQFAQQSSAREAELARNAKQLADERTALENAKARLEQQTAERLAAERKKLSAELEKQAREEVAAKLGDLQRQVSEKDKKLAAAAQAELAFLQQKQELDAKMASFELEKLRQLNVEREKIRKEAAEAAQATADVRLKELEESLALKEKKLAEASEVAAAARKERAALEEQKAAFETEKAKQIEAEREAIRVKAMQSAKEQSDEQMRELNEKLALKEARLAKSEEQEAKLRKERAEFEEQKQAFDLELARKVDEEADKVRKQKDEEHRLKEAEQNEKMAALNRQIDELKRKAEQGSQQTQGEVLELDLEAALKRCFPLDGVEPVAKGTLGADVIQTVRDEAGRDCGTIVWESKRTKNWQDGWLPKLKDDKLAAKAQIAVLVSAALPKDVATFECRESIWITSTPLAVPLAGALRLSLLETAAANRAMEGRADKVEAMYDYISGPQFKGRVTAIVDAYRDMKDDLDREKSAIQRMWNKREKQLERMSAQTAGLHGDLAGIIGRSLPTIEALELPAPVSDDGNGNGEE